MRWSGLPIRHRLTIAFAAGLAVVTAGLSVFVYARTAADLWDTIDSGLSSRAELLVADLEHHGPNLANVPPSLIESDKVFAQVADSAGRIVQSSAIISRWRLLPVPAIRSLDQTEFFERPIPGIDNLTRILAVPVATSRGRFVVMVGESLQDRQDELDQLAQTLAIGGLAAVILIGAGGWLVLAGALRPVERMRKEAAAISASRPDRRLTLPRGRDEISSLGVTLNEMLDRIEESVDRERALVDRASHELRTPLAIQRMDLDLALSGPQTVGELAAALRSVSAENTHMTRLTQDLLVLSRARSGLLAIQPVPASLPDLLAEACRRTGLLAGPDGPDGPDGPVQVSYQAPDERVFLDPVWFRQVIQNLVDNAVRHTPPGGRVEVSAARRDGTIVLIVEDTGPGFAEAGLASVFEPFAPGARAGEGRGYQSNGLGLAVVRVIAEAHGGRVSAENRPEGGARVTVTIPDQR